VLVDDPCTLAHIKSPDDIQEFPEPARVLASHIGIKRDDDRTIYVFDERLERLALLNALIEKRLAQTATEEIPEAFDHPHVGTLVVSLAAKASSEFVSFVFQVRQVRRELRLAIERVEKRSDGEQELDVRKPIQVGDLPADKIIGGVEHRTMRLVSGSR
jgi:hypothetical protein